MAAQTLYRTQMNIAFRKARGYQKSIFADLPHDIRIDIIKLALDHTQERHIHDWSEIHLKSWDWYGLECGRQGGHDREEDRKFLDQDAWEVGWIDAEKPGKPWEGWWHNDEDEEMGGGGLAVRANYLDVIDGRLMVALGVADHRRGALDYDNMSARNVMFMLQELQCKWDKNTKTWKNNLPAFSS